MFPTVGLVFPMCLQQILGRFDCWAKIGSSIAKLPERQDVGKALSVSEENLLLSAVKESGSPALLVLP